LVYLGQLDRDGRAVRVGGIGADEEAAEVVLPVHLADVAPVHEAGDDGGGVVSLVERVHEDDVPVVDGPLAGGHAVAADAERLQLLAAGEVFLDDDPAAVDLLELLRACPYPSGDPHPKSPRGRLITP